jgi:hypothetical protein
MGGIRSRKSYRGARGLSFSLPDGNPYQGERLSVLDPITICVECYGGPAWETASQLALGSRRSTRT